MHLELGQKSLSILPTIDKASNALRYVRPSSAYPGSVQMSTQSLVPSDLVDSGHGLQLEALVTNGPVLAGEQTPGTVC